MLHEVIFVRYGMPSEQRLIAANAKASLREEP